MLDFVLQKLDTYPEATFAMALAVVILSITLYVYYQQRGDE